MLQDQHEGERSGDNRAQHRQATCKIGTEERRPLETCWFFLLKKFFPHSFRAVVQKTRILYSQSGRKDESYSKIIQGHKCKDKDNDKDNDKDKDTDKVPEKPNICYIFEILMTYSFQI